MLKHLLKLKILLNLSFSHLKYLTTYPNKNRNFGIFLLDAVNSKNLTD